MQQGCMKYIDDSTMIWYSEEERWLYRRLDTDDEVPGPHHLLPEGIHTADEASLKGRYLVRSVSSIEGEDSIIK